jgi:hypothetical protein
MDDDCRLPDADTGVALHGDNRDPINHYDSKEE